MSTESQTLAAALAAAVATGTKTGDGRACHNKPAHAVVTPASFPSADKRSLPTPETSLSTMDDKFKDNDEATTPSTCVVTPTDLDVLCGRGKGIRRHPGNELYNKLLRESYDEYKAVPKGSKVLIVKKIISFVREGQASGMGRFLERKKLQKVQKQLEQLQIPANTTTDGNGNGNDNSSNDNNDSNDNRDSNNNNDNITWLYIDIGDERAMNKTAQAFRDIRVTMEKLRSNSIFHKKIIAMRTTSEEKKIDSSDDSGSRSVEQKVVPSTATATGQNRKKGVTHEGDDDDNEKDGHQTQKQQQQIPRRPTFRERLAMLQRQQQEREDRCESSSDGEEEEENNSDDDDIMEESVNNEEEISDTETEESFQMYSPTKPQPTKH